MKLSIIKNSILIAALTCVVACTSGVPVTTPETSPAQESLEEDDDADTGDDTAQSFKRQSADYLPAAPVDTEVSNNIPYEITIDGTLIPFPCPMQKLLSFGYEIKSTMFLEDDGLVGDSYTAVFLQPKEKTGKRDSITAGVFSPSAGKRVPLEEGYVYRLGIDQADTAFHDFVLPGNLTFGATEEEVLTTLGEPGGGLKPGIEEHEDRDGEYKEFHYGRMIENPEEKFFPYFDYYTFEFRDGILTEITIFLDYREALIGTGM